MGKLKVYELAKEMNLSNTEMLERLNKAGISVKSHLSTLEESDIEKVKGVKPQKAAKEEKKAEQPYIIRRNVRVININTSEEGKDIKEITATATGDIKKSHKTISNPKPAVNTNSNSRNNTNNQRNNNQNKGNGGFNRNRFQNNRNNIVITRNGKPVEKPEEKKEEVVAEPVKEVVKKK